MKTNRNSTARIVCIGGIFATLAVLFHSSPVFLPVIGLLLSPIATLPIALATIASTLSGLMALLTSAFILFLISPQEAAILIFATGSLGFVLGASFRKGIILSAALSAATLFLGMNILTYAAGIAVFGDMTTGFSIASISLFFVLFAVTYSAIWILLLRSFVNILKKTRQLDLFDPDGKQVTTGHNPFKG